MTCLQLLRACVGLSAIMCCAVLCCAVHTQAALTFKDAAGKQALDYSDEGDAAFRTTSMGTSRALPPGQEHVCVMSEFLVSAVDRLKERLDITKADERNEVRHACSTGCGWKGPVAWKFSHEWLDCINRQMKCAKMCGAVMRFRDIEVCAGATAVGTYHSALIVAVCCVLLA